MESQKIQYMPAELQNLDFDTAEKMALKLSLRFWNTYFQIIPKENGNFRISKYYERGAIAYCINNKYYTH